MKRKVYAFYPRSDGRGYDLLSGNRNLGTLPIEDPALLIEYASTPNLPREQRLAMLGKRLFCTRNLQIISAIQNPQRFGRVVEICVLFSGDERKVFERRRNRGVDQSQ
jgi:hypothetical protein